MLDFSQTLDLPLIFAGIIALAIFMYVLLDGFDLGVGILFPLAPSDRCRDKMMSSIAPFWDGNETWLVLGGGGLLAAFPLAFARIFPAFYIPITIMLLGLIFRGMAFEFRFKAKNSKERKVWDLSFFLGSLVASLAQGLMLGLFIEGNFIEQGFHLSSFSITTALALVAGYAMLGVSWLIIKSEGVVQDWAYNISGYILIFVGFFAIMISFWTPFLKEEIFDFWIKTPRLYYLAILPILTIISFIFFAKAIVKKRNKNPFFWAISIFSLCYIGLIISIYPYIIPYEVTVYEAAASPKSLSLILVGVAITLPAILSYTAYSYYIFRGKTSSNHYED